MTGNSTQTDLQHQVEALDKRLQAVERNQAEVLRFMSEIRGGRKVVVIIFGVFGWLAAFAATLWQSLSGQ